MQKLKFLTLFRALEEKEVPAFYKYLKQQHGGEDIALQVFDYLRKQYPNFEDDEKIEMAYAYRKIFGTEISGNANNRKKMLNVLSDLSKWLKEFLLFEKVRQDGLESQVLWLGILRARGLRTEFVKQATRFYTETAADPQRIGNSSVRDIAANYFQYLQLSEERPNTDFTALRQCMENLETYAEIMRLRMACERANFKKLSPAEAKTDAESMPDPEPNKKFPLLFLLRKMDRLIQTEQETDYEEVESLLVQYAGQLDRNELHGILGYLHNYGAAQVRKNGEVSMRLKIHRLNKIGLEHGFFDRNNGFSSFQFLNILSIAHNLQDFEWAEFFIRQTSGLLPDDIRPGMLKLAKADCYFAKEDFEQALAILEPMSFHSIHHTMRSRMLILRSYLALKKDPDKVMAYCLAFEALLGRYQKPQTEAVEATLAFIKAAKMLSQEKEEKQTILKYIAETSPLYSRNWLLQYAAGYKPRFITGRRSK